MNRKTKNTQICVAVEILCCNDKFANALESNMF